MVPCPPPLGCMKNSPGLPIRVSLNQAAGVAMATHMTHFFFINRHLATQMLCLQKHKITAVIFFCCRTGQAPTVCTVHIDTHTHTQPSAVLNI